MKSGIKYNILVLYSCPPGQKNLQLHYENKIFDDLGKEFEGVVKIQQMHATQIDDVHRLIMDGNYDIIQFSGHGDPSGGIILDKNDFDKGDLVSCKRILSLLKLANKGPLLTLFLSCYSNKNGEELAKVAPFVITSKEKIRNEACVLFCEGFYGWLCRGHSISESFEHARANLSVSFVEPDSFNLMRRQEIINKNGVFIYSEPKDGRDSILVNLNDVKNTLDCFGVQKEEVLHLLSRKLTIHYWIFDTPRDEAILPIGKLFFGEFSWEDSRDQIRCTKLMKFPPDVSHRRWDLWSQYLLTYNDLASSDYRRPDVQETDPTNVSVLNKAFRTWSLYISKYFQYETVRNSFEEIGLKELLVHVINVKRYFENATDLLSIEEYEKARSSLEVALMNYHSIVDGLQPPVEKIEGVL